MDTTTLLAQSPLFIIVLLALITVTLIALLVVLIRKSKPEPVAFTMDITQFDASLERIMSSTAHADEVSAVLGLMKQLDDNEDALELIKSYPETVRAAAWLHCINTLGADLQAAQNDLSDAHQGKGAYQRAAHDARFGDIGKMRKAAQEHVDAIRTKLNEAIASSGQTGLRVVN